jgi:hypothetical protein
LWRSRRGRPQPQRVRQTRPRVRHRLPMCPPRRLGFGRYVPVADCEGRAMARLCVVPEDVRCDLSAASHGSSPSFVRRAAGNRWSAQAAFGFHTVRIRYAFSSHSVRIQFGLHPRTEAHSAGPRPRCGPSTVPSRGPSCPTCLGASDPRLVRGDAWRSRGGRRVTRYAELTIRRSEDRREETNEITTWKLTHGMCLGEGTLEQLRPWR